MALTQAARRPGPSWDETIVPALRKRLESESRTLSRRMSAISVNSSDDAHSPNLSTKTESTVREQRAASPASYSSYQYTSSALSNAVPRTSNVQQTRTSSDSRREPNGQPRPNGSSSASKHPPFQARSRTYSQPYTFDQAPYLPNGTRQNGNNGGYTNGTTMTKAEPSSSRSNSPYTTRAADKPTRIPKVAPGRGRTTSTSSYANSNSPPMTMNNGYVNSNQYDSSSPQDNLFIVQEAAHSRSTVSVATPNSRQGSGFLHDEPAPFKPSSVTTMDSDERENMNRPSTDSEERPFEHWYRGESSRNGGVGELRVGKRMEMLDIANYGHTLRKPPAPTQARARTPVGMRAGEDTSRRRKRADSVAAIGARESFYLDEERAREEAMVLDEHPLTDLDGEDDRSGYTHSYEDYTESYRRDDYDHSGNLTTMSAPVPSSQVQDNRSITPTPSSLRPSSRQQQNIPPTRIPAPAPRQPSEPPSTPMGRGLSEPPRFPPSSSSTSPSPSRPPNPSRSASAFAISNNTSTPQSKTASASQQNLAKRRAKSPAADAFASASKKARAATLAKTRPKTRQEMEDEKNRRSVAYYPNPSGDDDADMMDAIPSWTQPVPPSGNWDDVVIPVVARKKGLDGHYEQADGSPRPRKRDSRVEPAPGTFGFDHSKYRPPRENGEAIPMDEFGRAIPDRSSNVDEEDEGREERQEQNRSAHDNTPLPTRNTAPSPAPFAHYAPERPPTSHRSDNGVPIKMEPDSNQQQNMQQQQEEEEASGGCCKCVIM